MNNMITLALAVSLLTSGTVALAASQQSAVDFRQDTMGVYKWYLTPLKEMATGKLPFDAQRFKASAEGLALATQLDVAAGFPEGSDSGAIEESDARAEIWSNWSDFTQRLESLQRDAAQLAKVAQTGDEAAIKDQFGKTAKNCGDCHKEYRVKK